MKALLTGLIASLLSCSLFAQKSPIKFGEIPLEDLKMTTYAEDSSAGAVVLCDYGEAYIQVSSLSANLNFERHVRIKILKKEGLRWADAAIRMYTDDHVNGLKASCFNLEGGKIVETKMSKDGVFKEKFNRGIDLQKFTIPNVKVGSVIEYSYKVVSDYLTNFPNWQFQRTIPTRHSEYWAIIPEYFVFEKYMQGYIPVTSYEIKKQNYNNMHTDGHHWIIENVPAFREEPFMTSEDDYLAKINFALSHIQFPNQPVREIMGSWAKLNTVLLESEDFGLVINGSGFLKKTVAEITAGMTDPMQKITAIHKYVKETMEWDSYKDFTVASLKKIFETKKGSSGDINLLLAAMLEKADLNVEMVLISTRDHGFVRKPYPMSRQFNYVVCSVVLPDKNVFLDATEKHLPVNVLPERCLNGEGLVISKTNHRWISLETKVKSKTVVNGELLLSESGDLSGKLNFTRDGYDANRMRKDFLAKGEETYVKEFLGARSWEVEKSEFQNIRELESPAKELHNLTIHEHSTVAGDVIYLNPFVSSQISTNPFTPATREYPVDFGSAQEKMYMCKITIPDGYVIDETPKSKVIALPGNAAKYVYNMVVFGNVINFTSNFQVNRNIFTQIEYPDLREFYAQVVAKQAEQIVLKKK
jgi:hypothetical protein